MTTKRCRWTCVLAAAALAGCGALTQDGPKTGAPGGKADNAGAAIAPASEVTTFGAAGISLDDYLQQAAANAPSMDGMGGGGGGAEAAATPSITNNQESGVDEGGIVKAHGDHMVVLRRGRLFTVAVGAQRAMAQAALIDVNDDHMSYTVATDEGYTLNLREEPNTTSAVLADLARGACLTRDRARPESGGWLPVVYSENVSPYRQLKGWVSKAWIAAAESCEGSWGAQVWYDEMLVSGDTIVVLGYNYQLGATELNLFNIDRAGQLTRVRSGRYYLRSNDYFSSDNYASRLIGSKLVFYMPYSLLQMSYSPEGGSSWQAAQALPGLRRGHGDWSDLIDRAAVYMPLQSVTMPVLHTVVSCDLAASELSCGATGVVGAWSRNFYVSPDAVYLWLNSSESMWGSSDASTASSDAVAFRIPLDGSAVGAARVEGTPVDQFSFQQRGSYLNVGLLGGETTQWGYNPYGGSVKLARIWLRRFGAAANPVPAAAYREIVASGGSYGIKNRFAGRWLLVATPAAWGAEGEALTRGRTLHVANVASKRAYQLQLAHDIERLDLLGDHAVVVGSDGARLGVSSIKLSKWSWVAPTIASSFGLPDAAQSESRSHGFGYSEAMGLIGLPIRDVGDNSSPYDVGTARTVYLTVDDDLALGYAGDLAADPQDVACETSCYDWYGNARPIFHRLGGQDRAFSLMGSELIEGQVKLIGGSGRVQEIDRVALSID